MNNLTQLKESHNRVLQQLNTIYGKLTHPPFSQAPLVLLNQYITIVLKNKKSNDQCFSLLCQHDILGILFNMKNSKNVVEVPMSVQSLKIFNLLLNNCKQSTQLGYILSQNSLHEGLFTKALQINDSQFTEYYSQILKSLIIKVFQTQNNSLIKLFYNSKFPSYPLMINCTVLAVNCPQELVKVTSKHSVLVLIKLLKIYKATSYLNQLPMLIFYSKLVTSKTILFQVSQINYLADLLWQIYGNFIACISLLNGIVNCIIIPSLKWPQKVLKFIRVFLEALQNHFKQQCKDEGQKGHRLFFFYTIGKVFYKIISVYMFSKYINNQYLSSVEKVNEDFSNQQPPQKMIIKKINENCAKTFLQLNCQNQDNFNILPKTVQFLKSIKITNSTISKSTFYSTMSSLWNQDYIFGNYLLKISNIIGFKIVLNERINLQNMNNYVDTNHCLFLTQYAFFMESPSTISDSHTLQQYPLESFLDQDQPIIFNELRGQWLMDNQMLNQILLIILKNSKLHSQSSIFEQIQLQFTTVSEMFIKQFKEYVQAHCFYHIQKDISESEQTIYSFRKISYLLKIKANSFCEQALVEQLQKLYQEIQGLFFENGYSFLCQFLINNRISQYYKLSETISLRKIILYETIQLLINPACATLKQAFNEYLSLVTFPQPKYFNVSYYSECDCKLKVFGEIKPAVMVIISLNSKIIHQVNVLNKQCNIRKNQTNEKFIHLQEKQEPIKMRSEEDADNLIQIIKQLRFVIEEAANKSIVTFFENSIGSKQIKSIIQV